MRNSLYKHGWAAQVLSATLTIAGLATFSAIFASAQAASLTFDTQAFTEIPASTKITLDDQSAGLGKILFKADVSGIADLRGLFFNVSDDSLLAGLQVSSLQYLDASGKTISVADQNIAYSFGASSITSVGSKSNTMRGDGNSHVFDAGVEIGKEGIGKGDDFRSAWFTLSLSDSFLKTEAGAKFQDGLQLSYFSNQDFGVRLMSVGADRRDSSKLAGTSPILSPTNPTPIVTPPAPDPAPVVVAPPVLNLPPVAIVPPTPESPEPTRVPEPGTATALAIVAIGCFKLLKRQQSAQSQI
ncbi:MAG: hypothetical protein KME15_16780 [Drouetiella hepatica Uher 2000/2452]|jgi:hypothetical protein|uniref:PEP-CTERM protein-sorting domain-containing protein n=1 Tax=Drouetiella hepatica Uher 2000/2452 TaxID=904376 RepID=A0A951QEK1_9CYAN|nr:hypothetical protein [Drouetiella hepatica Uher 2000/2452]